MSHYRHDDLLRIVEQAIRDALPGCAPDDIAPDHCLVKEFALDGEGIQRVFELLEEALGLTLWPALAIDFVVAGPSVGRLARWMDGELQANAEDAAAVGIERHHA